MEAKALAQSLEIRAPAGRQVDSWKNLVGAFLIGCGAGAAIMNGHATQSALLSIADKYGKAKVSAGCEQWRSHVMEKKIDQQGSVAKWDVPKDNCPHLDPKQ